MSSHTKRSKVRMLQLLADHATESVDANAAADLAELLLLHPEYDDAYFESSAAAIDLAMMPRSLEPLPTRLRDRILLEAGRFLETEEN